MTIAPTTDEQQDVIAEAIRIIDAAIPQVSGRTLVESHEVVDLLLDARGKLMGLNAN